MEGLLVCSTFFFILAHFKGTLNTAEDSLLPVELKSSEKLIVKRAKTNKQTNWSRSWVHRHSIGKTGRLWHQTQMSPTKRNSGRIKRNYVAHPLCTTSHHKALLLGPWCTRRDHKLQNHKFNKFDITINEQDVDPTLVNTNHEKLVTLGRTNPDKQNHVIFILPETMNASPSKIIYYAENTKTSLVRFATQKYLHPDNNLKWYDYLYVRRHASPRHFKNAAKSPSYFPSLASYRTNWVRACEICMQHKLKNKSQMTPE